MTNGDVFLTSSADGKKWTKLTQLGTSSDEVFPAVAAYDNLGVGLVSGNILQGEFIGDYTGVAMGRDLIAHPSWTDFRGKSGTTTPNQDAFTQAISLKPGKK